MGNIIVRPVALPADGVKLESLDTSFTTSEIFHVTSDLAGFTIRLGPTAPVTKVYPLDDWQDDDRLWDMGWVADIGDRLVGFVATRYESWNRRLVIWHLYIDQAARRQGVARSLLERAYVAGRQRGALLAWLEVSNANAPAIEAYRALGFELCGLDLSLYSHTEASGEVALYMARPLT